jgi:hypothetical protein
MALLATGGAESATWQIPATIDCVSGNRNAEKNGSDVKFRHSGVGLAFSFGRIDGRRRRGETSEEADCAIRVRAIGS